MRALILGCGYLGRRVVDRWLAAGHSVAALTRTPDRAAALAAVGIEPVVGDVADRASLGDLPSADVVLYAVGYDRAGGRDRRAVVVVGLRNALDALAGKTERLVYVSTTGVYGQSAGEWIDESSPTGPDTESGRLALEAENAVLSCDREGARDVSVLRFTGLYGPGRLLRRVEQLRAGEPIAGSGDAWLNLVHVDDAAAAVLAAAERLLNPAEATPFPGPLLVTDDRPVRRRDYYGRLAEFTGSPPPTFDPAGEGRVSGLGKRCRNDAAKRTLGWVPVYPTFEEGLRDALVRS